MKKILSIFFSDIQTCVIPNVVDPNYFHFRNNLHVNEFTYIHVANFNSNKNLKGIIDAFLKINIRYPNSRLIVVGEYPNEFLINYLEYCEDCLDFVGSIDNNDVAFYLQNANAFLLFSDTENLPCVIAESLCCGVPVVSSNVGGIPEMITTDNGILVPPRDEDALFNAMEDMMLNYARYDRKQISIDAQAKYNPKVVGQQIVDVYNEVLSKLENDKKRKGSIK